MRNNNFDNWNNPGDPGNGSEEYNYPDFYYKWDESLSKGIPPLFLGADELSEILEIYFNNKEVKKARKTIDLALKFYPEDEELLLDILLYLNDFELWDDLFSLSKKYKDIENNVEVNGHQLTALLHLGMEEDAFLLFRKLKKQYENDKDNLSIIYQIMGESLNEIDLFDASVKIMEEAVSTTNPSPQYYWILLNSYVALELTDKIEETAGLLEKLSPLNQSTWFDLGNCYFEIENYGKAIDAFEFSKSLGNTNAELYFSLINAYEKNKNLQKALETAKEYIQLFPDYHVVYLMAANLALDLNKEKEAIDLLDDALMANPESESLYLYKSLILLKMGEYKKAMKTIQEGIDKTEDANKELKKELKRLQDEHPDLFPNS